MATPVFDFDRSLNALLYVANRIETRDIHKIFKILYFADMSHLSKYGRAITGDRYIAMKYGPVPSSIYDMVKIVRGDSLYVMDDLKAFFDVRNNKYLEPLREADIDCLSATDVAELDYAIVKYKNVDFKEMTRISHGSAWQKAWDSPTDEIALEDILRESGAAKEYIDYIVENIATRKELGR